MLSNKITSHFLLATLLPKALACLQTHQHVVSSRDIIAQIGGRSLESVATRTVIENVRVFNGETFTSPRSIAFANGLITADADNVEVTIDGTGKFLIPGLIDAHIHIPDVTGLEATTSYGVTTALNMACRDYTYAACTALRNLSGRGLTSLLSSGIQAVGPPHSNSSLNPPPDQVVYPDTNVIERVDWAFGNSSDYFKILGAVGGLTQEQHNTIVRRAHALNRQTMTHASDVASYQQAVESRTNGIQHVPLEGLISPSTLRSMVHHAQFSTPTMTIFKYGFDNPLLFQFLGRGNNTNATYATVEENVRRLHAAGVPIVAGTDAVGLIAPGIDIPFGPTLHGELELLHRAGLSPLEALRAATVESAKQHRLSDRGVIGIGKRADLVMLNSNPLLNISNTRDLAKIWVGGIEYKKGN